jgi:hypothetical protein
MTFFQRNGALTCNREREGMVFNWREKMRGVGRYSTPPIQYVFDGLSVLTRDCQRWLNSVELAAKNK